MLDLHSLFLHIANPSSWDLSIESHNGDLGEMIVCMSYPIGP